MLIRVCIAVLLGLVAAQLEPVPMQPTQLLFAAVVAAVGALLARGRAGPRELGWMCCAGALGGLHGTLHGTRPPSTPVIDAPVVVQGTLISQPQLGQRLSRARARLDDSGSPAGQSAGPPVVIVDRPDGLLGQLAVGDRIQAEGRLRQTEPRGPLAMPFPRLRLLDQPADGPVPFATRLRGAAERAIQARLPEPQAGLATGVLLGGSAGLTADMRQALRRSGLAHLVVIDGYKQVLVAGLVESVAVRLLGRRLAWLPVLVGIVGYTLLSGGP